MNTSENPTPSPPRESDLAAECLASPPLPEDAAYKEARYGSTLLSALTVKRGEGIGKPCGRYLSLSFPSPLVWVAEEERELLFLISQSLRFFFSPPPVRLLVAGLGNRRLTADSLGAATAELVDASGALPSSLGEKFGVSPPTRIGVCVPDVFAKTGIESVRTIAAAAKLFRADAVLVFDALAAKEKERLLSVIEFTDTGTVPGGGVKSGSAALTSATVGVPVVAVGIPTVVRTDGAHFLVPRDLEAGVRTLSLLLAEATNRTFAGMGDAADPLIEHLFSEECL